MNEAIVYVPDETGGEPFTITANDVVRVRGGNASTGMSSTATVTTGNATISTRGVTHIIHGKRPVGGDHTEYEIKPTKGATGLIVVQVSFSRGSEGTGEATEYRFNVK